VNDVPIRVLGPADSGLVSVMHGFCFPEERWSETAVATILAMPGAFGRLALSGEGARPLGFLLAQDTTQVIEILSLGVLPESRRRGVAASLIASVVDLPRPLVLEVAEDNAPALALYAGLGFLPIGRRAAYYQRRGGAACAALTLRRERPGAP
jgi:ribosomal-protein-alanine N-acetyltransferase